MMDFLEHGHTPLAFLIIMGRSTGQTNPIGKSRLAGMDFPIDDNSRYSGKVLLKEEVAGLDRSLKIPLKLDLLIPLPKGTTDRASPVGCFTLDPAPGPRSG